MGAGGSVTGSHAGVGAGGSVTGSHAGVTVKHCDKGWEGGKLARYSNGAPVCRLCVTLYASVRGSCYCLRCQDIREASLPQFIDSEICSQWLFGVDRSTAGKAFDARLFAAASDERSFITKEQLLSPSGHAKAQLLNEVSQKGAQELFSASEAFLRDSEFMEKCIDIDNKSIWKASPVLLEHDRDFAMKAVQVDGLFLAETTNLLQEDRDIAMAACRNNGMALEFVSPSLQNDTALVLEAVQSCGLALQYASERLKDSKEICLAAVRADKDSLEICSRHMRDEKSVVLAALTASGLMLRLASPRLRNEKEVVLYSVKRTGDALRYASKRLRADREVVVAAVSAGSAALGGGRGAAIRFASVELRNDPDIVAHAIGNFVSTSTSKEPNTKRNDPNISVVAPWVAIYACQPHLRTPALSTGGACPSAINK